MPAALHASAPPPKDAGHSEPRVTLLQSQRRDCVLLQSLGHSYSAHLPPSQIATVARLRGRGTVIKPVLLGHVGQHRLNPGVG